MVTPTKTEGLREHLAEKVHNLGADQLIVVLSNTAPTAETTNPLLTTAAAILANITQIAYTFFSTRNITTASSLQTGGTYKLTLTDLVLTVTGGAGAAFRYIYIVNDTTVSPIDAVLMLYDNGSVVNLADGDSFTVDFSDAGGALTIT